MTKTGYNVFYGVQCRDGWVTDPASTPEGRPEICTTALPNTVDTSISAGLTRLKREEARHTGGCSLYRITVERVPRLALWNALSWVPNAFHAEQLVLVFDKDMRGRHRLIKERLTVLDDTHVQGRVVKYGIDRYTVLDGVWHVSELRDLPIISVRAYNEDYTVLLGEWNKPGVDWHELTEDVYDT